MTTPETRARPLLYFLVLLPVNFMWAFQFSGDKMASEQLGPIAVAFVPVALSTLLLISIVLVQNARRKPRVIAERRAMVVRNFILLALCGSARVQVCLTIGLFGVMIYVIALHERIRSQLLEGGSLVFVSTFLVTTYEERRKMRELQTAVAQPLPTEGSL